MKKKLFYFVFLVAVVASLLALPATASAGIPPFADLDEMEAALPDQVMLEILAKMDAVNAVLASLDRDVMESLKDSLGTYNNIGGDIDSHCNPIIKNLKKMGKRVCVVNMEKRQPPPYLVRLKYL